jgi:cob(I)alamin adenosyltransferase
MHSNSITTRTGDKGSTSLFSGELVDKDSPRTSVYGDVDELNSVLGVARAASGQQDVRDAILEIQNSLFVAGAELATSNAGLSRLKSKIDGAMVKDLDDRCADLEGAIRMPGGFIIPGGTLAGGHIDHARTIARRIERGVVRLFREGHIGNEHILVWINRLSDYLWLLARQEEGDSVVVKE